MVLAATVMAGPASAAGVLGQVNAHQLEINGVATPSHTTLLSSSTLKTASHPAIVQFVNGQTLSLAPHSQARFDGSLDTGVEVSLNFGSIAYRDGSGEVVQIADAGTFTLQQAGVQNGEPISAGDASYPICSLKSGDVTTCLDDPEDNSCDWEYLDEVASSDVAAYFSQGMTFLEAKELDRYFSQPGHSSAGLDMVIYDCREKKAAVVAAATGGLSAAAIAGIAVGGALGVVLIDDATSSDPPTPEPVIVATGTQVTP